MATEPNNYVEDLSTWKPIEDRVGPPAPGPDPITLQQANAELADWTPLEEREVPPAQNAPAPPPDLGMYDLYESELDPLARTDEPVLMPWQQEQINRQTNIYVPKGFGEPVEMEPAPIEGTEEGDLAEFADNFTGSALPYAPQYKQSESRRTWENRLAEQLHATEKAELAGDEAEFEKQKKKLQEMAWPREYSYPEGSMPDEHRKNVLVRRVRRYTAPKIGDLNAAIERHRAVPESWAGFIAAHNPLPFIEDVAGLTGANSKFEIDKSIEAIQAGRGTLEDYDRFAARYIEQERENAKGITRRVTETIADVVRYGTEFAITGGAYGAGKTAASIGLRQMTAQALKYGVPKSVVKAGAWTAPRAAGIGLHAAANPLRVANNMADEMIEQQIGGLVTDDKGRLLAILEGKDINMGEALPEAYASTFIELGSERSGLVLGKMFGGVGRWISEHVPGASIAAGIRAGLVRRVLGESDAPARKVLEKLSTTFGWQGTFTEIGEEYVNQFGRWGVGIDEELQLPSMTDLVVMGLAFSVPGFAGRVYGEYLGYRDRTVIEPVRKAADSWLDRVDVDIVNQVLTQEPSRSNFDDTGASEIMREVGLDPDKRRHRDRFRNALAEMTARRIKAAFDPEAVMEESSEEEVRPLDEELGPEEPFTEEPAAAEEESEVEESDGSEAELEREDLKDLDPYQRELIGDKKIPAGLLAHQAADLAENARGIRNPEEFAAKEAIIRRSLGGEAADFYRQSYEEGRAERIADREARRAEAREKAETEGRPAPSDGAEPPPGPSGGEATAPEGPLEGLSEEEAEQQKTVAEIRLAYERAMEELQSKAVFEDDTFDAPEGLNADEIQRAGISLGEAIKAGVLEPIEGTDLFRIKGAEEAAGGAAEEPAREDESEGGETGVAMPVPSPTYPGAKSKTYAKQIKPLEAATKEALGIKKTASANILTLGDTLVAFSMDGKHTLRYHAMEPGETDLSKLPNSLDWTAMPIPTEYRGKGFGSTDARAWLTHHAVMSEEAWDEYPEAEGLESVYAPMNGFTHDAGYMVKFGGRPFVLKYAVDAYDGDSRGGGNIDRRGWYLIAIDDPAYTETGQVLPAQWPAHPIKSGPSIAETESRSASGMGAGIEVMMVPDQAQELRERALDHALAHPEMMTTAELEQLLKEVHESDYTPTYLMMREEVATQTLSALGDLNDGREILRGSGKDWHYEVALESAGYGWYVHPTLMLEAQRAQEEPAEEVAEERETAEASEEPTFESMIESKDLPIWYDFIGPGGNKKIGIQYEEVNHEEELAQADLDVREDVRRWIEMHAAPHEGDGRKWRTVEMSWGYGEGETADGVLVTFNREEAIIWNQRASVTVPRGWLREAEIGMTQALAETVVDEMVYQGVDADAGWLIYSSVASDQTREEFVEDIKAYEAAWEAENEERGFNEDPQPLEWAKQIHREIPAPERGDRGRTSEELATLHSKSTANDMRAKDVVAVAEKLQELRGMEPGQIPTPMTDAEYAAANPATAATEKIEEERTSGDRIDSPLYTKIWNYSQGEFVKLKKKILKKYGVNGGNRFAKVYLGSSNLKEEQEKSADVIDVKIREGQDGIELSSVADIRAAAHRQIVEEALAKGRDVPYAALASYPDLMEQRDRKTKVARDKAVLVDGSTKPTGTKKWIPVTKLLNKTDLLNNNRDGYERTTAFISESGDGKPEVYVRKLGDTLYEVGYYSGELKDRQEGAARREYRELVGTEDRLYSIRDSASDAKKIASDLWHIARAEEYEPNVSPDRYGPLNTRSKKASTGAWDGNMMMGAEDSKFLTDGVMLLVRSALSDANVKKLLKKKRKDVRGVPEATAEDVLTKAVNDATTMSDDIEVVVGGARRESGAPTPTTYTRVLVKGEPGLGSTEPSLKSAFFSEQKFEMIANMTGADEVRIDWPDGSNRARQAVFYKKNKPVAVLMGNGTNNWWDMEVSPLRHQQPFVQGFGGQGTVSMSQAERDATDAINDTSTARTLFAQVPHVSLNRDAVTVPYLGVEAGVLPLTELVSMAEALMRGKRPIVSRRMKKGDALGFFRSVEGAMPSVTFKEIMIGMRPDLWKIMVDEKGEILGPAAFARVLAHEMGHLQDFLPQLTMKRGSLVNRLLSITNAMAKVMKPKIKSGTNKKLRNELIALTKWWNPWDEAKASKNYNNYRKSSRELYAEAISVLYNAPKELRDRAPLFWDMYFKELHRKPEVMAQYMQTMDLLTNRRGELAQRRAKEEQKSFVSGDQAILAAAAERKAKRDQPVNAIIEGFAAAAKGDMTPLANNRVDNIDVVMVDKTAGVKQRLKAHGSDAAMEAYYLVDELGSAESFVRGLLERLGSEVFTPLREAGMQPYDLGRFLLARRVIFGDRAGLANPKGYTPETSYEQMRQLQDDLGPEGFTRLKQLAGVLTEIQNGLAEQARDSGIISQKVWKENIEPHQANYATFLVWEYIKSDTLAASVYKQSGTFMDVANPGIATVMKMIAQQREIQLNNAKKEALKYIQQVFPDEIELLGPRRDNLEPQLETGFTTLDVWEDGQRMRYSVPAAVAAAFNRGNIAGANAMFRTMGAITQKIYGKFHQAFVTYNPTFVVRNMPRDFFRTWHNMKGLFQGKQNVSMAELFYEIGRALPAAWYTARGVTKDGWQKSQAELQEMMNNGALATSFVRFDPQNVTDLPTEEKAFRSLMRSADLEKEPTDAKTLKETIKAILSPIEHLGVATEYASKLAGYRIMKKRGVSGRELTYNTRKFVGTPDLRQSGTQTQLLNFFYMYAKVRMNALHAQADLALHATKGRSQMNYLAYVFQAAIWPAIINEAMRRGWLGEAVQAMHEAIPEYFFDNYLVVPLGLWPDETDDDKDKALFVTVPMADESRWMTQFANGAIRWMFDRDVDASREMWKAVSDISPLSSAPWIAISSSWGQYLAGRNPYDDFRDRSILSQLAHDARGWHGAYEMAHWTMGQTGLAAKPIQGLMDLAVGKTWGVEAPSSFEANWKIFGVGMNALLRVSDDGVREEQNRELQAGRRDRARFSLENVGNASRSASRTRSALNDRKRLNARYGRPWTAEDEQKRLKYNIWYSQHYDPRRRRLQAIDDELRQQGPDTDVDLLQAEQKQLRAELDESVEWLRSDEADAAVESKLVAQQQASMKALAKAPPKPYTSKQMANFYLKGQTPTPHGERIRQWREDQAEAVRELSQLDKTPADLFTDFQILLVQMGKDPSTGSGEQMLRSFVANMRRIQTVERED